MNRRHIHFGSQGCIPKRWLTTNLNLLQPHSIFILAFSTVCNHQRSFQAHFDDELAERRPASVLARLLSLAHARPDAGIANGPHSNSTSRESATTSNSITSPQHRFPHCIVRRFENSNAACSHSSPEPPLFLLFCSRPTGTCIFIPARILVRTPDLARVAQPLAHHAKQPRAAAARRRWPAWAEHGECSGRHKHEPARAGAAHPKPAQPHHSAKEPARLRRLAMRNHGAELAARV